MDIEMPIMNGIETTIEINKYYDNIIVSEQIEQK